jgi:uncharacterized glyoxalase superfamily protein PhnB
MRIDTYLYFDGRCDEAIECYRGAVSASRFGMVADRFGVLWTAGAQERSAAANA